METTKNLIHYNATHLQPLFDARENQIMKIKHIINSCLLYASNNLTSLTGLINHEDRKKISLNMRSLTSLTESYHKTIADLMAVESQIITAIEYRKQHPEILAA
jgi:hypothetical protein